MNVTGSTASRSWKSIAGLIFLGLSFASVAARAQAPYLIPYTINVAAGGGTAPVLPAPPCLGTNPGGLTPADVLGDGCPVTSASVVTGADLHDVGVDPQGNIVFVDNQTGTVIRRIDARTGVITVLAGTDASIKTCTTTAIDEYGDGCPSSDGKANAVNGYTNFSSAKTRGIAVAKNGDVYLADYSQSLVHKISASTGFMTLFAGYVSGTTVAKTVGLGTTGGYSGDGSAAVGADLSADRGVAVDTAGNVYIADTGNSVIRMVNTAGIISTIVGVRQTAACSSANWVADSVPARTAILCAPEDVEVDANGNIFIADQGNARIRVVYAGGAAVASLISLTNSGTNPVVGDIYTIMGNGSTSSTTYVAGTQVIGTSVGIGGARKIALDSRGNVYLADNSNNVIWFLDASTGYMRTIGGMVGKTSGGGCTGQTDALGDNCPATQATLNPTSDMGVAVDAQGNIYIGDSGDSRLRKISINTSFPTTTAGNPVTQTLLVHFARGDTPAAASPFAITGSSDFAVVGGAPSCTLNADNTTDCTLSVQFTPTRPGPDLATLVITSAAGLVTNVSLSGVGAEASISLDPGTATLLASSLSSPGGVAQDASGNVYVADTGNNRIVVSATTFITAGGILSQPRAVAVTPDGALYIADTGNNAIRRVDPVTGAVSTFGGGTPCALANDALGDGCPGASARFSAPAGLAADPIGNVYISDTGNNVIRELTAAGYVYLVAGGASACTTTGADTYGNGCGPTQAIFKSPTALLLDPSHNLYIADTGNNEVRKITAATNLVSAVAGTGQAGASGNGGLATTAQVNGPTGIALDAAGSLYIADTGNHAVRVVNATGDISTVVGNLGSSGAGTLPGVASGVLLNLPGGVVASGIGKLWVLDSGNSRLFSLDRSSVALNFGRTNVGATSPTTAIQETATGSATANLGYPLFTASGNTAAFTLLSAGFNGCSSSSSTPQSLAPGVACNLTAQFVPTAVGSTSAIYVESNASVANPALPNITLSGTGAVLTGTTLTTAVTTPATGTPQYSIPFVVTATLHPAVCDPTAPNCTAAGTITFFVDGTQVGLPVAVSNTSTTSSNVITAAQTIGGQSVGSHSVVAVYSGDTYYASSTAATLAVSVAQGSTTTVVSANPNNGTQFVNMTLTAQVTSATSTIPTGSVSFYAGSTLLGSSGVNPNTGFATLSDVLLTDPMGNITHSPGSFGLFAGTYKLTAVYSGDSNYATSTSAATNLAINPDPQAFTLSYCNVTNVLTGCTPPVAGTAQGSTAATLVYINPSNTLNGTLTFACTNLPANSDCTFSATPNSTPGATELAGSTLTFTPVPGAPTQQSVTVTLWTNVNPSNIPPNGDLKFPLIFPRSAPALAGLIGWPIFLGGFGALLGFRKRLRNTRLLTLLTAVALAGGAMALNGCTSGNTASSSTPVGTYTVTLTVTGPGGLVQTTPIKFVVGPGIAGQS